MSGCLKWVVILWTVLIGVMFLAGMMNAGSILSEKAYSTDAEKAGAGIGVTFGAMAYAFIWGIIAIPATVLFLMFRPSTTRAIKCFHCGAGYAEGSKFCPACGKQP